MEKSVPGRTKFRSSTARSRVRSASKPMPVVIPHGSSNLNDVDRLWPVDCSVRSIGSSESCQRPILTSGFATWTSMARRPALHAALRHRTRVRRPRAGIRPRIGLALGGGFARGIAHTGVLMAFERHGIPLHCVTGVSAGSIVAAAYASGVTPDDIARAGSSVRFRDVARWSLCRMGFMATERMKRFLERLLKAHRFEEMRIPLGIVATDLCSGEAVSFRDSGDVFVPS